VSILIFIPPPLCSDGLANGGEWSCLVFGQAIAVFLKSTTTLVNLDLSYNELRNEGAEAWDSGRTNLILLSVWPSAGSSDRPKTPV